VAPRTGEQADAVQRVRHPIPQNEQPGPSPSSRMATPEKRKATAVQQNDTPRGKKNARCGAIGEKFSRANAMVY